MTGRAGAAALGQARRERPGPRAPALRAGGAPAPPVPAGESRLAGGIRIRRLRAAPAWRWDKSGAPSAGAFVEDVAFSEGWRAAAPSESHSATQSPPEGAQACETRAVFPG
ncbi:unnamed protein product [Coccothraustes coccothraustes]